jgi:hypothetical protein
MATKATKASAKKSGPKKSAAPRLQEKHYLPPWVVIGKTIEAAFVGVDPKFKSYVVSRFDADSGWVELGYKKKGKQACRRTHHNNVVIQVSGG